MPLLLQIAVEANKGSVGRIAEQIGQTVMDKGWTSYIAYARKSNSSNSNLIKIGSDFDVYWHGIEPRIFDNHCFGSRSATKDLIDDFSTDSFTSSKESIFLFIKFFIDLLS